MTIHVKLITPITMSGLRKSEHLDILTTDYLKVTAEQIEIGPNSIECEYEEAMSQPGTILKIIDAEKEGCDAVVIDCMGDPGLQGARECVSIPVIGPCETSMHYASMLGHKFSVLTVLERTIPLIENLSLLYGVSSKLASVTPVNIPVLELLNDLDFTYKKILKLAQKIVKEDRADAILFGCMTMSFAGLDKKLEDKIGIPVLNAGRVSLKIAESLVSMEISHSKQAYPFPAKLKKKSLKNKKVKK